MEREEVINSANNIRMMKRMYLVKFDFYKFILITFNDDCYAILNCLDGAYAFFNRFKTNDHKHLRDSIITKCLALHLISLHFDIPYITNIKKNVEMEEI